MGFPIAVGEGVEGIEDRDGSAFVAGARVIGALDAVELSGAGGDGVELLQQGGLIVLDLDDQGAVGRGRDLEGFFWQCKASRVTR